MRMRLVAAALVLVALGTVGVRAQSGAATPPAVSDRGARERATKACRRRHGPVPVPEPSPLAMQRYRSGIVLWIVDTIWGFVLPGLVLMTGLSARMRDWSTRIGRKWFFIIAIYFAVFSILTFVIDLPRAYYEEFVRDHAYGLSNQTFQKWFSDSRDLAGRRHHRRHALSLDPVPAAAQEPPPLVALHRAGGGAVPAAHDRRQAGLDRPAVQHVRPDEGQGARGAHPAAGRSRGDCRQPRLRGGQEHRHQRAERVRHRLRRHEADRAVGHDHQAPGRAATALRDGPRDGPLRARPHVEARRDVRHRDSADALRHSPHGRRRHRPVPRGGSASSRWATSRRCRSCCCCSTSASSSPRRSPWRTTATSSTRPIASGSRSRARITRRPCPSSGCSRTTSPTRIRPG